jgi:endo-1,4-beta-xylanase
MLKRRTFLAGAAAMRAANAGDVTPLRDLAAARNVAFGSEITLTDIADPAYAALVARECAIVTPGIEAKWGYVEPTEGQFRFGPIDALAKFARGAGVRLHMHNLIWAVGLPNWTLQALAQGRGRQIVARHISEVAGRYESLTDSWDVINEPADPRWPAGPEGLCTTPWRRALGPDFVKLALTATRAAAPAARLLINDDDLEYATSEGERKRATYLRLIESWRRSDAPLDGFGLEAHLKPWLPLAEIPYRRFLHELAGFNLKLYVTELDVCDRTLPPDIVARDTEVANLTRRYLDLVLDEPAVCTVILWGLSDRSSWMNRDPAGSRPDGLKPRPLPYDAHLTPKPMRAAIAASFRNACFRP